MNIRNLAASLTGFRRRVVRQEQPSFSPTDLWPQTTLPASETLYVIVQGFGTMIGDPRYDGIEASIAAIAGRGGGIVARLAPNYDCVNRVADVSIPAQAAQLRTTLMDAVTRGTKRIFLIGDSLGGLIIASLLTEIQVSRLDIPALRTAIQWSILIGSPIQARSVVSKLERSGKSGAFAAATAHEILDSHDVVVTELHKLNPRMHFIIGECDGIADRTSIGVADMPASRFLVEPTMVRGCDHYELPSHPDTISDVRWLLEFFS